MEFTRTKLKRSASRKDQGDAPGLRRTTNGIPVTSGLASTSSSSSSRAGAVVEWIPTSYKGLPRRSLVLPQEKRREQGLIMMRHRRLSSFSPSSWVCWSLPLCIMGTLMWPTLIQPVGGLDITQCRLSLGMQSMEIPDSAITASSAYDEASVGSANARIRTEINGGAWCPKQQVSKDVYEWLQIDLGELKVISLVETQGRFGNGQGQEFADQYLLEYQREEGGEWFRFHNRRGQEIFQGNTNTYIAELREVDPPIIARKVRFIPYSDHPRTVCMRLEVYGCTWRDGTVSYDMRQGERRGGEVDLYDFTYDGTVKHHQLTGGLGQLTDGELGETNFRLDPKGFGIKGYEWVGWKNESHHGKPAKLIFKFDEVRNFTVLRLHCNNMFSKDVRVFKKARMSFSIGGQHYTSEPVEYRYMRDTLIEFARQVTIPLQHKIGKYVMLELWFDSRWMMISEVQFESDYAVGNFSVELAPTTTIKTPSSRPTTTTADPNVVQVIDLLPNGRHQNKSGTGTGNGARKVPPTYDNINGGGGPGATVGAGPASGTRSTGSDKKAAGSTDSATGGNNGNQVGNSSREKKSLEEEYIGIIIGALAALILLLFVVIVVIILRQRRRKFNNNHQTLKTAIDAMPPAHPPRHITLDLNDLQNSGGTINGKLHIQHPIAPGGISGQGNLYNTVANPDLDLGDNGALGQTVGAGTLKYNPGGGAVIVNPFEELQQRKLPEPPLHTADREGTLCRDYAVVPDIKSSFGTLRPNIPPPSYTPNIYDHSTTLPRPRSAAVTGHYATADVVNVPANLQGVSGNNMYSVANADLMWTDDLSIIEFPRDSLKFIERLGEGQFGEVHLCEAHHITDLLCDDFLVNRTSSSSSMLVAVKTLRQNADAHARDDFHKEVKIMSRIKDPNIVRVLGVCTRDEPISVIVEYMKYGDLNQFLRSHVPEGNQTLHRKKQKQLSRGCLIYMATQIASGMKYLESLNMVHRDLATRNCLVGHHYCIKISDFGMSRNLYSNDYYRIEGRAVLPIRWMAWESVLLGKFSCKTDVWSFGVTLWEILTFAKEQPFDEQTDEQVIENCGHYYRNDGLEQYLPPPMTCTREIYDLMKECWNRDEVARPSFREIHMFLQRKNMGYDPKLEKTYHKANNPTSPYV